MRRLSPEVRERIEEMLLRGAPPREIAQACGVTERTIYNYRRRLMDGSKAKVEEGLESDAAHFMSLLRARVDPRAPIMAKWVEDLSWWEHFKRDFLLFTMPEALRRLGLEELDLRNPEATARLAASRLLEAAARGDELKARLEEAEARHRAELDALKRRLGEYEEALRRYRGLVEEYGRLVDDAAARVKRTIAYFMLVVPKGLPADVVPDYMFMARRAGEIWAK
jgi:transposase-like protein